MPHPCFIFLVNLYKELGQGALQCTISKITINVFADSDRRRINGWALMSCFVLCRCIIQLIIFSCIYIAFLQDILYCFIVNAIRSKIDFKGITQSGNHIYIILVLKICSNLHMRLSSRNTKRSNISTYLVSNDLTNIGFITLSSISFISIYADVDRNEQIFLSVCFEWLCAYLISILWFQIVCKQCSI